MNYKDRMFVVRELRKIARELRFAKYVYDPGHKNNPGKGFRPTPRGWTTNERRKTHEDRQDDGPTEEFAEGFSVSELNLDKISGKIKTIGKDVEQYVANIHKVKEQFYQEVKINKKNLEMFRKKTWILRKYLKDSGKDYSLNQTNIITRKLERFKQRRKELEMGFLYYALIALELPEDQHGEFQIGDVTKNLKKEIYEIPLRHLEKMVGKNVMPDKPLNIEIIKKMDRSITNKNCMNMREDAPDFIYLHEVAHWIEQNNPKVKKLCIEFLEYRTLGEEPELLKEILKSDKYKDDERAKKDKFPHPYCGKIYEKNGKIIGTEILSMGIQMLKKNWEKFYNQDPEYFGFVIGVLRGTL